MKKWISMIVAMICIIGCILSMSACGEHTHDYESVWSSNATQHWHECKNDGCDAKEKDKSNHVDEDKDGKCDVCEYVMSSGEHTHDYDSAWRCNSTQHWHECKNDGCDAKEKDKSNHVDEDKDGECDVCRYVMGEEHTHNLKKQEAKEATCTENGNEAYYECDECGKLYTDENGENEIDKNSVVIFALGHFYVDGVCTKCGQKEEPEPTEGLKCEIDGEEAYVSGIGTATDKDIVIAKEYNGKPVTSIVGRAFENCSGLTSITIPETVVLLSRQTPDDYLEVNVELDDDFLTKAESKGTYDQIKQYIYEKYKIKVSNLYIAQVKDSCGIKERANYNYPKKENSKQPQVPEDKRKIILEALKVFKMI